MTGWQVGVAEGALEVVEGIGAEATAVVVTGSAGGEVHQGLLRRSDVRQARVDGAEYGRDRAAREVSGPLPVGEVFRTYSDEGHPPCVARILAQTFLSAALAALLS